jgi:hypothetical protein
MLEGITIGITYLLFAFVIFETVFVVRSQRAVKGSHERYVTLSIRRVLSWAVNITFVALGILNIIEGDVFFGPIYVLFGIYFSYTEYTRHKDDDDWFNGRGKKIWKGVKKRLTVTISVPSRSPATA